MNIWDIKFIVFNIYLNIFKLFKYKFLYIELGIK